MPNIKMPSQPLDIPGSINVDLTPLERLEFQDATRYFLASPLTSTADIHLPPLETSSAQRDKLFATFDKKNVPQVLANGTPETLKSLTFWRTLCSENGATLPPEVRLLAVQNQSCPLQRLPIELLEIIDRSLSFRDKVSFRLTSRALFIRFPPPATKNDLSASDLDDLKYDWKLCALVEREKRRSLTVLRAGDGTTVKVPMLVCSFCCSCHHQHYFSSKQIQKYAMSRVCIGAERDIMSSYGGLYNIRNFQRSVPVCSEPDALAYDKKELSNSLNSGKVTLYLQLRAHVRACPDISWLSEFHQSQFIVEEATLITYERYKVEVLRLANNPPRYRGMNRNGWAVSLYNTVRVLQEKKDKMCPCIAKALTRKKVRELQDSVETFEPNRYESWREQLNHPSCLYRCRVYCAIQQHPYVGAGGWGSNAKLIELIYRTAVPRRDALYPSWMLAIAEDSMKERGAKRMIPRDEEQV